MFFSFQGFSRFIVIICLSFLIFYLLDLKCVGMYGTYMTSGYHKSWRRSVFNGLFIFKSFIFKSTEYFCVSVYGYGYVYVSVYVYEFLSVQS